MVNSQESKTGKHIKELRLKMGLSQDQLARKADVAYTTFTKVESGVIKNPSVYFTAKIVNTSIDRLINV